MSQKYFHKIYYYNLNCIIAEYDDFATIIHVFDIFHLYGNHTQSVGQFKYSLETSLCSVHASFEIIYAHIFPNNKTEIRLWHTLLCSQDSFFRVFISQLRTNRSSSLCCGFGMPYKLLYYSQRASYCHI